MQFCSRQSDSDVPAVHYGMCVVGSLLFDYLFCFQVFLFCFGGLFVFWEVTSRVSSIVSSKSSLRFKVTLLLTQFSL